MLNIRGSLTIKENPLYTVFPKKEGEVPREFSSFSEALEFALEFFPEGDFVIESPNA